MAGGLFAWLGVALLFVGIVIDTVMKQQASSEMHSNEGKTLANPTFQNLVMYSAMSLICYQFLYCYNLH